MVAKRAQVHIPDPLSAATAVWQTEYFLVDEGRRQLRVGSRVVPLESLPFNFLLMLVKHSQRVVTKDELLAVVWGGRTLSDSALAKCVSKLRAALGSEGPRLIRTAHSVGYQLAVPAQRMVGGASDESLPPKRSEPTAGMAPRGDEVGRLLGLVLGQGPATGRYDLGAGVRSAAERGNGSAAYGDQAAEIGMRGSVLLEEAAWVVETQFGDRPDVYGAACLNLATALQNIGAREPARALLMRALLRVEALGSSVTFDLRFRLAGLATELGRFEQAETLFCEVLVEAEAWYGSRSAAMMDARQGLACLEHERADYEQASARLNGLLLDCERWYPQDEVRCGVLCWLLARSLLELARCDEAEVRLDQASRGWSARLDPASMAYNEVQLTKGALRLAQGLHADARRIFEQLLVRCGEDAPAQRLRVHAHYYCGLARLRDGDSAGAEAHLQAARASVGRHFEPGHPWIVRITAGAGQSVPPARRGAVSTDGRRRAR